MEASRWSSEFLNVPSRIRQDLRRHTAGTLETAPRVDMIRQALARTRQIHVGIVGGGFAGLRCADVLLNHGCKVTIVEARDRLGGRVAQSNALGHSVDLGPNWIHGSKDNPIKSLADLAGTTLHDWDESSSLVYDEHGKPLDEDETSEFGRLVWDDGLISQAFAESNANRDMIDPGLSLADYLRETVHNLFIDLPAKQAQAKRDRLLQYASIWGAYIGSDYRRQSLRNFWLEECIEGENPFVAGTYSKILEAVAAPARQLADIRLNTVVEKIRCGRHGSSGKVNVQTMQAGQLDFDEIVVTAPLGWLKRNGSAFDPPLDSRLSAAIDHIGYGTLDKIYVSFPSPFWTSSSGQSPGMLQWLDPTYAPKSNEQHWGQNALNLADLPSDTAHPTLLFYVYGDCAAHIGKLIKSATSDADADAKLIDFVKPYYSLLPNYDVGSKDCQPTGVLATAWVNDEFAGFGSYSNFQIPLENGAEDVEVMRHGMPDDGLWLAGEHTAPFIAMGTSTGAYMSGEAVAKRIAEAYGLHTRK